MKIFDWIEALKGVRPYESSAGFSILSNKIQNLSAVSTVRRTPFALCYQICPAIIFCRIKLVSAKDFKTF